MGDKMKKVIPILIVIILALSSINAIGLYSEKNEYEMVVIAPEIFSSEIAPLIDHKNNYNVLTFLKTTEEIYSNYEGRDHSEQIKYYIKDALETLNIKYVLLMGGRKILSNDWYVPARYSQLDDGFGNPEFLSDLYFADIYKNNGEDFEDWDSNENGIFGEWGFNGDELDLIPDISIGRLPCRTKKEVEIVVNKIIYYETNSYGQSWFKNMVVMGGDTFPDYEGIEGEFTCNVAADYMNGFEITRLFTSTGELTSSNNVIESINEGCGFLFTRGRGGTDRVRMVLPEGSEIIAFQNDDISRLENNGMYPICILGECIHGRFDVGILNIFKIIQDKPGYTLYDCIPECIAWRLVREKNGGSIATITNTNICFGAIGDNDNNGILDDAEIYGGFLAVELFRFYGEEEIDILGDVFNSAISSYIEKIPEVYSNKIHSKSVQEFVLIGDPSLKIGGYE